MFETYRKQVLAAYQQKKNSGKLSMNLLAATSAKIKAECSIIYKERPLAKDDDTLRLFFIAKDKNYAKGITEFGPDGFKQLVKVLNGKDIKIGEKYIELLAWLIDFEPRPYQLRDAYEISADRPKTANDVENCGPEKEDYPIETEREELQKEAKVSGKRKSLIKQYPKFTKTSGALILTGLVALVFYFITKPKYMYWAGDRYETLSYFRKVNHTMVVDLDEWKLDYLRRITQPDTITESNLNKVWYVKVNVDSAEFYTAKGEYPLDTNKVLKPVTSYIFEKYILKR